MLMGDSMKGLCIVLVLTLFAFMASCNAETYEQKEAKRKQAREAKVAEKQTRLTELVNEFTKTYDSDRTWQEGLKGNTLSTFQLQQSLIRSDSRPILFLGNLMDLERRDGKYGLLFHVPLSSRSHLSEQYLVLDLDCLLSDSQANSLEVREFYAWQDPTYLVAAQIHSVKQAHQFLETHLRESASNSSLDTLKMEFVAKGKCIGLQSIVGAERE